MAIAPAVVVTCLLVVGFLAQWLAWRIRVPAILPLLLTGIGLGPVTGWFDPDAFLGDMLFPVVSLAVALILFEGSLTLRFSDLRDVGAAVRGLVTYGALITLALLAGAVHWLAGLSWPLAFLFGALGCVTGPTVITPLLRTLRPTARIARVLRWEGIVLDPVGALFAVLMFEGIVTHEQGHSLGVFGLTILVGVLVGLAVAYALGFLLFRQKIPELLHTYGTLVAVLGAFTLANRLAPESGLLAVTVMGIVLGNMRDIHIEHIMDFKQHLSMLLVSMLFLVLAARLTWPLPPGLLWGGIAVFVVAQLIIRPVSVALATWGSLLNWRERILVGCIAPRGIVAAAVASLLALRLQRMGLAHAGDLVPLVFILIIGTVVLQSVVARPLARWLKVADPDPDGVMIYGADQLARTVGQALAEHGIRVLMVDDDWDDLDAAERAGLATFHGNPTSQYAAVHLDLTGIGHLLAMSTRRELNSLTCMQYRPVFGRESVYRLRVFAPSESADQTAFAGSIQSRALFRDEMTHARLNELLSTGWRVTGTTLTEHYTWPQYLAHNGPECLLLFARNAAGKLRVTSDKADVEPRPGWRVVVLVPPDAPTAPPPWAHGVTRKQRAARKVSPRVRKRPPPQ